MRPEAQLHEYRFDLSDGTCRERPLDDVNTEFPAIHQGRTGRPSRWAYNMRLKVDQTLLFDALLRYDLEAGSTAKHEFGPGRYGSEVVFIPRDGATSEDDGYLSM
jgi:carotenoid cleavage dioxygenase